MPGRGRTRSSAAAFVGGDLYRAGPGHALQPRAGGAEARGKKALEEEEVIRRLLHSSTRLAV